MIDLMSPSDPPEYPACPCCGATDYSELFFAETVWVGCDICVTSSPAPEYFEEKLREAREIHDDQIYERMRDEIRFGG